MAIANTKRVLVLRAAGINCDEETAAAVEMAGGRAERVHVNRIADASYDLLQFAALVIPGGFSYGDHLGAGRLLAVDVVHRFGEALGRFVEDGRPVLGICNGFQVLAKAGLLPDGTADITTEAGSRQRVSLAENERHQYECRWVSLRAETASSCIFTRGVDGVFSLPVGHGEGCFMAPPAVLDEIEARGLVAVRYVDAEGRPATSYPANPNGSANAIAGISNAQGNVLGLMPHPDRAFLPQLHPDWLADRTRREGDGLALFRNMVRYAREI